MTRRIKLAIAGLGSCASAIIQGLHYYKDANDEDIIPGLMHTPLVHIISLILIL